MSKEPRRSARRARNTSAICLTATRGSGTFFWRRRAAPRTDRNRTDTSLVSFLCTPEFRVSARGNFERVFGASSGFALRSVLASSPAREALAPAEQPAPRERVANVGGGVRFATPAERSPWDGILEEFGAAPAPVAAAAVKADTTKLDRHGGRPSGRVLSGRADIADIFVGGRRKRVSEVSGGAEAAARAVGAAAADVGTSYEYLVGAAARDRDPRFFTSDSAESARLCLDAPALSLRDMRRDVRARALEDAAAVLRPAALALCAAATREKRFLRAISFGILRAAVPSSLVARVRADDSDDLDVSLRSDDSERDIPARRGNDANESSFGARLAARERNARCAGCDARVSSSASGSARARCAARRRARTACASVGTRRRRARARFGYRGRIPGTSPGTYPGTDASAYVFLCVATPTCLASATAAARRAGLARRVRAKRRRLPVSSLRAAGGFHSVAGVLEPHGHARHQPGGERAPEHARRRGRRAEHRAGVRAAGRGAKFRAEARQRRRHRRRRGGARACLPGGRARPGVVPGAAREVRRRASWKSRGRAREGESERRRKRLGDDDWKEARAGDAAEKTPRRTRTATATRTAKNVRTNGPTPETNRFHRFRFVSLVIGRRLEAGTPCGRGRVLCRGSRGRVAVDEGAARASFRNGAAGIIGFRPRRRDRKRRRRRSRTRSRFPSRCATGDRHGDDDGLS